MKKKCSLIIIILLGLNPIITAQEQKELFTIYLVRHSEKELVLDNYSNPSLSICGMKRSDNLKNFFNDINLDIVYSTNYVRTKSTALPTAASKDLEIEEYDGGNLKEFSKILTSRKQNALVVGHSNTTGVLAGILVNKKIGEFDVEIYDRLYKVIFHDNISQLHLLHMDFNCDN